MSAANRTERLWIGGAVALAMLIALVGWFMLISPQRAETADVQSQTADAQTQNLTLQSRINQLNAQKKNSNVYLAMLAKARQALPERSGMSLFLRDVQAIASATSTQVSSLNVGDLQALTPAVAAAPTTAPSSGASSGASSAPANAAASGTTSSPGSVFTIPIDASVVGKPSALGAFLTRLQSAQPRAVLVSSVTLSAGQAGGAALQLKLTAFVAPSNPTAPSSAAPGAGSR